MEATKKMPDTSNWIKDIVLLFLGPVVGWLASSFTRVSRTDFKEMIVRVEGIEKQLAERIPRAEFRDALNNLKAEFREDFNKLREDQREALAEIKQEIRALRH